MRRVGVLLFLLFFLLPATGAVAAPSLNGRILIERPEVQIVSLGAAGADEQNVAVGYEPSWSPDGKQVAFARDFSYQGTTCCAAIWVVPTADTDAQRSLEETGATTPEYPKWSPDGTRIAYQVDKIGDGIHYQEIWVVDADGTGPHLVARANQTDRDQWSWSPDSSRIVVQQYAPGTLGPLRIAVADATTGDAQVVARGSNPSWSPTGKHILFTRAGRIYRIPASGGHARRLTIGDVPRYSPDGKKIAFVRYRTHKRPPLVLIMRNDGRLVRRVATVWTPYIYAPVWSPDSKRLVWEAQGARSNVIYTAYVYRPSTKQRLGLGYAPSWSRPACTAMGTGAADELAGAADGGDVLCGFDGDDHIVGGPGDDVVFGDLGNDVIDVRGGGSDAVSCGPGNDTVLADSTDVVTRDCETVRRG